MVEKLMQANLELSDRAACLLYENYQLRQLNRELRNELQNTIQTIKLGLNNGANSKHNGNGNSSLSIVFVDV